MIGLIVPDSSNPFFAEIAKGVEDAGYERGYSVILCNSNASIERELVYLDLLRSKRVEGIILSDNPQWPDRPFVKAGIPFSTGTSRRTSIPSALIIFRRLYRYPAPDQLGHREIACIQPAGGPQRAAGGWI
jgi:LacI family transcriptional regulator